MGVHGLWRLIEPSGKPVPLELLENKILAVDVSIWLHHFIKGFQDSRGGSVPNAHLLGIYHRVCKLLYFRIKPIFVFDGGVPILKKNTIALRNQQKQKSLSEADQIQKNLLSVLSKHGAISKVLSEKATAAINATSPQKNTSKAEDLFVLPPTQFDSTISDEESSDSDGPSSHLDLHSIDTESAEFKSLPIDVRHEILTDLKETRKQNSWGRIHELPTESNHFSSYQMNRLLKRQSVQIALENIEKEMGGHSLSLVELEKLLKDEGVITNLKGNRIASDENTRFLLIKDIKQALAEAKQAALEEIKEDEEKPEGKDELQDENKETQEKDKADQEFESDLKKSIMLSLDEGASTSKESINESRFSILDEFDEDEESEEEVAVPTLSAAQSYMMEYSGLSAYEINRIISSKSGSKKSEKAPRSKAIITENSINEENDGELKILESNSEESLQLKTNINVTDVEFIHGNNIKDSVEQDIVEVMSDSDSGVDDFIDVDQEQETNTEIEVFIKPNETIEDDLFKDIFEEEVEEIQDTVKEVAQTIHEDSSIKTQITKMVQDYATVSDEKNESQKLSDEQLNEMRENLKKERKKLVQERGTKERLAGNITDQMCQEAQELLELFGIPYIVAPMEAEAQCAFLDLVELTDGTITDDSDVWLFGGRTVYKNFFDQNKHLMEFRSTNIQQHYKLSREQMILLAMLVGSDYTTGLNGVGPVTALEILAAFPPKDQIISGLAEFKTWFNKGKMPGPGRTSLRSKLKNVSFTENFPNPQIIQAYLEPTVETSREKFSWAKPDVIGLIDFAKQKFGWTQNKSEEILNPILRRLEDSRVQRPITDFFKYEGKQLNDVEMKMSKRVKSAVNKIANGPAEDEERSKSEKKKRTNSGQGRSRKKKKDEELEILAETVDRSKQRLDEIHNEVEEVMAKTNKAVSLEMLHKKDSIPQRQKDKAEMLKKKLKAIETFRKSKQGPGFVKKRSLAKRKPASDASYLSEGSSSD